MKYDHKMYHFTPPENDDYDVCASVLGRTISFVYFHVCNHYYWQELNVTVSHFKKPFN